MATTLRLPPSRFTQSLDFGQGPLWVTVVDAPAITDPDYLRWIELSGVRLEATAGDGLYYFDLVPVLRGYRLPLPTITSVRSTATLPSYSFSYGYATAYGDFEDGTVSGRTYIPATARPNQPYADSTPFFPIYNPDDDGDGYFVGQVLPLTAAPQDAAWDINAPLWPFSFALTATPTAIQSMTAYTLRMTVGADVYTTSLGNLPAGVHTLNIRKALNDADGLRAGEGLLLEVLVSATIVPVSDDPYRINELITEARYAVTDCPDNALHLYWTGTYGTLEYASFVLDDTRKDSEAINARRTFLPVTPRPGADVDPDFVAVRTTTERRRAVSQLVNSEQAAYLATLANAAAVYEILTVPQPASGYGVESYSAQQFQSVRVQRVVSEIAAQDDGHTVTVELEAQALTDQTQ